MSAAVLILPHQLFDPHPALGRDRRVYLVEVPRFFRDEEVPLRFHQQKLALHRASLKAYQDRLIGRNYPVHYLDFGADTKMAGLWDRVKQDGVEVLYVADPADYSLEQELAKGAKAAGLKLQVIETPAFICSREEIQAHFQDARIHAGVITA